MSNGAEEAAVAVSFLAGKPRQDRLGAGWATVYGIDVPPADSPSLQLLGVDAALGELASTSGPGSKGRRSTILEALFAAATPAGTLSYDYSR